MQNFKFTALTMLSIFFLNIYFKFIYFRGSFKGFNVKHTIYYLSLTTCCIIAVRLKQLIVFGEHLKIWPFVRITLLRNMTELDLVYLAPTHLTLLEQLSAGEYSESLTKTFQIVFKTIDDEWPGKWLTVS